VARKSNPFSKYLYEEVDLDSLYSDGHWITLNGRPMYIGGPARKTRPKQARKDVGKWKIRRNKKGTPVKDKAGNVVKDFTTPNWWDKKMEKYKFAITASIAKNAERMQGTLEREITRKKKDKKTAVATIALMMLESGMRVGGGRSGKGEAGKTIVRDKDGNVAGTVDTLGATTLQKNAVRIQGNKVFLKYIGKKGVDREVEIDNKVVADSVREYMGGKNESPDDSSLLFTHSDGGDVEPISRRDVAARMKRFDPDYKPKDLRTMKANSVASKIGLEIIDRSPPIPVDEKGRKKLVKEIVDEILQKTSDVLGNTPKVAQENYVNPKLIEAILEKVGLS